MYTDKDSQGRIQIMDMTSSDIEILMTAVERIVEQLPDIDQRRFRRLLIDLDKLIQKQ